MSSFNCVSASPSVRICCRTWRIHQDMLQATTRAIPAHTLFTFKYPSKNSSPSTPLNSSSPSKLLLASSIVVGSFLALSTPTLRLSSSLIIATFSSQSPISNLAPVLTPNVPAAMIAANAIYGFAVASLGRSSK